MCVILTDFCRSFLRLGDPLCCTINDITIDQLEREANRIAPIANLTDPSPDKQTSLDSEPVKQESSISDSKEHNKPLDISKSELGASTNEHKLSNGASENEKGSDKKTKTDDVVCNQKVKYGGSLSLARIQSLVSMTTPRSGSLSNVLGSPSFIEIDHSIDGFGCLFLPSVFPQAINVSQQLQGKMRCIRCIVHCMDSVGVSVVCVWPHLEIFMCIYMYMYTCS